MSWRPGRRAWIVRGPNGGLMRFNGGTGYYESYSNRGLGDVFLVRKDAEWVAKHERDILKRLADHHPHGSDERREWQEREKRVCVMPVLLPQKDEASADVRALKMAYREMKRTGYWPSERELAVMRGQ